MLFEHLNPAMSEAQAFIHEPINFLFVFMPVLIDFLSIAPEIIMTYTNCFVLSSLTNRNYTVFFYFTDMKMEAQSICNQVLHVP